MGNDLEKLNQKEIDLRPIHEERARLMDPQRANGAAFESHLKDSHHDTVCPFYSERTSDEVTCRFSGLSYSLKHCSDDKRNCADYKRQMEDQ